MLYTNTAGSIAAYLPSVDFGVNIETVPQVLFYKRIKKKSRYKKHACNFRTYCATHGLATCVASASPNRMSDLLLTKKTNTNEMVITTNPMASVRASCDDDGFRNMRALSSCQVDSDHVE